MEETIITLYNELSQIPNDNCIKATFIKLCEKIENIKQRSVNYETLRNRSKRNFKKNSNRRS